MKDIGGLLRVSEGSDTVRVIGQGTKRDSGMWNQVGSGSAATSAKEPCAS